MALGIRKVEYCNTSVADRAGEAYKLLSLVAGFGVSLLAFKAAPLGPTCLQFTLFPDDVEKMNAGAKKAGLNLDGPHSALLIEGDDKSGSLADIYRKLSQAGIHGIESSGIADIKGGYRVVLYLAKRWPSTSCAPRSRSRICSWRREARTP